ncbi:uncharacterized protein JCM15063_003655 [Sporobolomyces koalae]|uniref:uncharacterized protein n=1 Tax=Sporobolomyces koalae TaxID=500713 RepID=UPI00317D40CA
MHSNMQVNPIHLAPLHPSEQQTPSSLSHKDSFLSTFQGESNAPTSRRRRHRLSLSSWNRQTFAHVFWAGMPLVIHTIAIALLLVVLLSNSANKPFMSVKESGGTGLLQYYVTNSCAVTPGRTERVCTARSLYANFVPSLTMISSSLPGFSALKLPFYSDQTPSIMLTSLCLLIFSLVIYLPLWILAYFPNARLPPRFVRFVRYKSRPLFYLTGVFSFLGFIFILSIGIGYNLYFIGFIRDFDTYYRFGVLQTGSNGFVWTAEVGDGFGAVWAATTCAALTVIGIKISLHNGLDEKVEWPKDLKDANAYGMY